MGRRLARVTIILLVAAALFLPQLLVQACGPDLSPPTFTDDYRPDVPFHDYARGRLGLLDPGYAHIYLYAAYRNLAGKPLTESEIAAIKNLRSPAYQPATQTAAAASPRVNWVDRWLAARKKVLPDAAKTNFGYYTDRGVSRSVEKKGEYFGYYNCLQGAFQNAVAVLGRRVGRFGVGSPYVKQWLGAQDQVFANCTGGSGYPPQKPVAVIPAAAPASDPEVIREDRVYQIAAAHFYAGDFEDARTEFAAIAADSASPYRQIAPYLVARALVRQGTLNAGIGKIDPQPLDRAQRQLETILANKNLSGIHHAARDLLAYIRIRLYPDERELQLERALDGARPDPNFSQNLTDYLWLLGDRVPTTRVAEAVGGNAATRPVPQTTPERQPGEMSDWILTFQKQGAAAFQHSLARWQATRSLPWLVSAISKARASDPAATALESAALHVTPNSPAYVMVTFHRLRLLAASGHPSAARTGLDRALSNPKLGLSRSSRNQFFALRMTLATSLDDWLRYAPRVPAHRYEWYVTAPQGGQNIAVPLFDADASEALTERFPLHQLAQAARSRVLPAGLRKQIAIAAWTRAILLGRENVAREITPVLAALAPGLKGSLAGFASAKGAAARKFAAVDLILHFPAMRPFVGVGYFRQGFSEMERMSAIDTFRNNWWCGLGPAPANTSWEFNYYTMNPLTRPLREIYPGGKVPSPAFLTTRQRAAATAQWTSLQRIPSAPDWLGRQTLAWAQAHPKDPRVPEALYLLVRATRYGCEGPETGNYSRRAFNLLHKRYPGSPWTRKTPYWFR